MTPEGKIKKKISALLKEMGVFYIMPIGGAYSAKGVSDYVACINGHFVAIEAKADGSKRLTALQKKFLVDVYSHNGSIFTVYDDDTLDELREVLVAWKAECK
jgi:hypothetical protein